jgi:hypothetical protein
MPISEPRIIFVSFFVKMLQILSTEPNSTSLKICQAVLHIFTALSQKTLDKTTAMSTLFRNATSSTIGDPIYNKIQSLFTKSNIRVIEHVSIDKQGSEFKKMLTSIVAYVQFTNNVMIPLVQSSTYFLSVTPLLITILVSSLSTSQGTAGPMFQINHILSIAKIGTSASISVKLKKLYDAQREIQNIVSETTNKSPNLIGEMIRSVETDSGSSSTSNLDTKISILESAKDIVSSL